MTMPNTLTDEERAAGWRLLFDGRSFDGWRGYRLPAGQVPERWRVEDGALHIHGEENRGNGDLITIDMFADFELSVEWTCPPKGNSGILYRVTEEEDWAHKTGPEFQILDDAWHMQQAEARGGIHDPLHRTGGCYGLYGPPSDQSFTLDAWNHARIIVRGNQIEHHLNGQLTVSCEMHSHDWKARIAGTKFAAWTHFAQAKRGHIALQDHGHHHMFRNVKVREI